MLFSRHGVVLGVSKAEDLSQGTLVAYHSLQLLSRQLRCLPGGQVSFRSDDTKQGWEKMDVTLNTKDSVKAVVITHGGPENEITEFIFAVDRSGKDEATPATEATEKAPKTEKKAK